MRLGRFLCALACLLAAAALVVGCGSSGSDTSGSSGGSAENTPAPPKSAFPKPEGHSLQELVEATKSSQLAVLPAAMVFYQGKNRFPFGIFEKDQTPVSDAEVALYMSKVPKVAEHVKQKNAKGAEARAKLKALEEPAIGPFPASIETLETLPAFRAVTTTSDPNAATVVYKTELNFPTNGEWRIAAVIKEGNQLTSTLVSSAIVGGSPQIPQPGQQAPLIHTPTPADVAGDLSQITTRVPPDTQNRVDYADALGKEPILLLFATPQFCESRVCGPVVDVAEQVKQTYEDQAAFIHMEIWKENDPSTEELRPQVEAFHLPTEPWLFAIDSEGKVVEVVEGAFGVQEMTRVAKKAIAE